MQNINFLNNRSFLSRWLLNVLTLLMLTFVGTYELWTRNVKPTGMEDKVGKMEVQLVNVL